MLSQVLTSLQEVKSQLQNQLAQQPEYRALLILDKAVSQLGDVFTPVKSYLEDAPAAITDGSAKTMRSRESAEAAPNPGVCAGAPRAVAMSEFAAAADAPPLAVESFGNVAQLSRPAHAAQEIAHDENRAAAPQIAVGAGGFAQAPVASADIFEIVALDESDVETSEGASADGGLAAMSPSAATSVDAPAATTPDLADVGGHSANGAASTDAPSGLAAAYYETAGDLFELDSNHRLADPPAQPVLAADKLVSAAKDAFNQILAKAAQADAAPKAAAPRSYLPFIVAPRPVQNRQR
jgi:hypothetical protein